MYIDGVGVQKAYNHANAVREEQVEARWDANYDVTMKHLGYALVAGAVCDSMTAGKLIICTGADRGSFAGGTTFGNVFITDGSLADVTPAIISHENVHATQWAQLGEANFLAAYGVMLGNAKFEFAWRSLIGANGDCRFEGCYIYFEQQAGLNLGGYAYPDLSGRG